MKPTGLHHITAIAGDPVANVGFYRDLLGLRLIKRTVNFDDPSTYHLYFGDRTGTPGTAMTFFPWGDLPSGRAGAGMVVATAFAVSPGALAFWKARLDERGISWSALPERFGEPGIRFSDPDGLVLELLETASPISADPWTAEKIPPEAAIRGFHSATGLVREQAGTAAVLKDLLGARETGREGNRIRYAFGDGGPGRRMDLVVDPEAPRPLQGKGTVHHIAYGVPDDPGQQALRTELVEARLQVSPVMDRNYFHSIYFREPSGMLFEVATDGPGFAVDEPEERLGATLMLPAQYEPHRAEIERRLPPLDG